MTTLRPGHSTRTLVVDDTTGEPVPVLTTSELRDEVGLFGDTSHDALVSDYERWAVETCGVILGADVHAADVVDRYVRPPTGECVALELSAGWLDTRDTAPALTVTYLDTARQARVVPPAGWFVDDTIRRPVVYVETALSDVHPRLAYPVSVAWRSELYDGLAGYETVRQSVRLLCSLAYESRGGGLMLGSEGMPPSINPVARLLRQHRP